MVPNMVIYYAGMHTPCVACTLAKDSHIKADMSVSGAVTAVTVTVTLRVTRYVTVTLHCDTGFCWVLLDELVDVY